MKSFIILFTLLFSFITSNTFAQVDYVENESTTTQNKPKIDFKDRLYFGGNIALNFGRFTVVGANPSVGYRITDNFSAGLGATYMYYKQEGYSSESFYGGNVFLKQLLFDVAFLQAEYHLMNVRAYGFGSNYGPGDRINIPMFYVGGGYRQQIGENIYLVGKVLWDIIDHQESRFQNPVISGGVSIGL